MQLAVLGLNHNTAPIELRERFALDAKAVQARLEEVYAMADLDEAVLLATCNRTELYVVVAGKESGLPAMEEMFRRIAGELPSREHFYYYKGEDVVRHLFRVASGMDSLVLGEGQILSQVKVAYLDAARIGTTGPILNILFQRALAIGKKIRTETSIADNPVSVSYAAVKLVQQNFGTLTDRRALILGAGTMSELMAKHLIGHGVKTLIIANRSLAKAELLAERYHGRAVPLEERLRWAARVDVILTSTGADSFLLDAGQAAELMHKRRQRPLVLIDIAVPRDIDPRVADIEGIELYNLDDLTQVVDENKKMRAQEAELAYPILEEAVRELMEKYEYFSMRPMMVAITDRFDIIRKRIVKRAFAKLPAMEERERRVIENMSKIMMRKLLRDPMIRFRMAAGTEDEELYCRLLEDIYRLPGTKENEDERTN
ncbi:MAG: glutamyl-tRNA reductase [Veillonellaceae bacterium]|nr:glutamyl-tRNA reductase [Veillonellaceae bacterium]